MQELKRSKTLINKKYMEYFVPTVLTAMANNIAVMVDATIVGNILGSSSLAAVNLLSPITQLYFSLSILFGLASATIIAKAKGKAENAEKICNQVFTSTVGFIAVICALLMVVQFLLIDSIVGVLSPNADLQHLIKQYYIPIIAGTPITLFMTSGIHLVRTDGRPKFASNIIIVANIVNLSMDLITICIFKMGIMGASIATITGNFVGFVMILTHLRGKNNTLRFDFSVFKNPAQTGKYFLNLVTTGVPGALGTMLITIRMLFLNTLIQQHGGKSAIVAYSVVSLCQVFVSAFITGASQTMIPVVSLLLGEGDFDGIKIAFRKALKILLVSSTAITVLVEIVPQLIAGLYGLKTAEDLTMGVSALRISSLLFPALAISFLMLYYFMCTGKKLASTLISVANGIIFIIPFGILFAGLWGITGVWISLTISQIATALFSFGIAFVYKLKSKGKYNSIYLLDEKSVKLLSSFTVSDNTTNLEEISEFVAKKTNIQTADILLSIIKVLALAELEKHRKHSNTDIRICEKQIIIKNSGALVNEDTFKSISKDITYSKALGFNQIRFSY